MNKRKIISWALMLLSISFLGWWMAGVLVRGKMSQRVETRHAKYVAACKGSDAAGQLVRQKNKAWLTWKHGTAESVWYEVRMFPDRRYLVEVRNNGALMPASVTEGTASQESWDVLLDAMDDPENLDQSSPKKHMEPRVVTRFNSPRGTSGTVAFYASEYPQLTPQVKRLDEAIAAVIAESSLRPPRRYARVPDPLTFAQAEIPNLVRGLESGHSEAFPHIVGHLASIGEPALPELERVLTESKPKDPVSVKRIKAVLKGLEAFPETHQRVLPKVREIAAVMHPNARRGPVVRDAADFAEDVVIKKYQQETFARRGLDFVSPGPPSAALRAEFEAVWSAHRGTKAKREALPRELADLGPGIFPLVVEQLRERQLGHIVWALLDALGAAGGPDAILLAVQMDAVNAGICVRSLVKLGDAGIPALLLLLETGDLVARGSVSSAFHKDPAYRSTIPQVNELLERKRRAYVETAEEELRTFHRDGIFSIIGSLMALQAKDLQTVENLRDTAVDAKQDNNVRSAALKLLRRIGAPAAASVVDALKEQAGYEAGAMRSDLIKTARELSGE